jgi:hypothetical protein
MLTVVNKNEKNNKNIGRFRLANFFRVHYCSLKGGDIYTAGAANGAANNAAPFLNMGRQLIANAAQTESMINVRQT